MATNRIAAAALQYSKKLSKFICWVWAVYRFAVLIVAALQPVAAEPLVNTIPGVDTIMMVNVSTYLINSLGEKYIYSDRVILKWLEKGGWKSLMSRMSGNDEDEEESRG